MTEELSIRDQVAETRKKYDILMDNEEYKLETQRLTEKERHKIMNGLYDLQEEEKYVIHRLQQGEPLEKIMNSDGWEHCPRCKSNRVKQKSRIDSAFTLWVAGFICLLIGFIIWPLLIVAVILFLISPIGFLMPKMNICKDCKNTWPANK